jgi:hypothetical protein
MSKQAIIAIVVAVIIILGAGGAFLYSQTQKETEPVNTTISITPTKEASQNLAATGTFLDLLANGKTSKCTFSATGENGKTNGTIYISGEKARAEISITTSNGKEAKTYMIKDGDTFYMWGDSLKVGVKMVMNMNEFANNIKNNQDFEGLDPNQKVDYKCSTWTLDNNQFAPPTNIKFMSITNVKPSAAINKTSITPAKNVTGTNDKSTQCAICNQLTGEAKNTCLTQLNCN